MNLQRREEISALLAEPVTGEAGQALEYRDALMECRTHIDTLEQTAAERVIARGAVVKPHTFGGIVNQVRDIANQHAGTEQLRERIAYALAPHFERDGGPVPDYTGEGSAWVPPVEARAVVVPDDDRPSREFLENYVEGFDPGERSAALFGWREGCRHLREHSRAIPTDRVPGEGMVAVDREWIEDAVEVAWSACKLIGKQAPIWEEKAKSVIRRDPVRANQGGAAT